MTSSNLFESIKVGAYTLDHRVVLAPLTRLKATKKTHVPITSLVEKYYSQRSSRPGSLLITEATYIAAKAGGFDNVPGIYSAEQIAAWKKVTDGVHANGSYIFLQIWAHGRGATPSVLEADGFPFVAPSAIPIDPKAGIPREMTETEIQEYIELFAQAAKNAVEAGFDGVEVHSCNGFLLDQFLQDVSNQRTDRYGGSVENRSRFGLEVVQAVTKAIGEERTGIRISPWNTWQKMRMADPIPQFTHFITQLKAAHPGLAYLSVCEPDAAHPLSLQPGQPEQAVVKVVHESNDFIRDIWAPKVLITAGDYTRESAMDRTQQYGNELIAFGKMYIANPDLPTRLVKDLPLNPYQPQTFYVPGDMPDAHVGYIDYPFADQSSSPPVGFGVQQSSILVSAAA